MDFAEMLVSVRVQDLAHGASACVTARPWQLRTLVAYLFDGRECGKVRRLLGAGSGIAHGTRVSWEAVVLSGEELAAIEATFPSAMPERALVLEEVSCVVMLGRNGESRLTTVRDPVVLEAAPRARYLYFDYGPWADLYESPLSDGGLIRYEVPREGLVQPWTAQ